MTIQYRMLGPLTVSDGGRDVALPAGHQRTLLAALLLRGNEVVTVDELVPPLWSGEAPEHPRAAVQTLVTRLRRILGTAAPNLETWPAGYRLTVPPDALDLHRFMRRIAAARQAVDEGDLEGAADQYIRADALWSGPPLADVPSDWLQRHEVPRLTELRLHALEESFAVQLRLGRHDSLIGELRAQVALHPLRERLWAQLMSALHAAQRQSEALTAYRSLVALLRDELGVDPGPEVQRLHRDILSGTLTSVVDEPPDEAGPLFQLPPDIPDFVGHHEAVAAARQLLDPAGGGGTVPVVVLWGQAGVGKTTTGIHVAHRLREQYPDGQLYVNLAGAGPGPRDPAEILAELLRDLGVDGRRLPEGIERRAASYRARLADRRILVFLDDAGSAAQLTPLLPGTASCGVLVTSRHWLGGLASVRSIRLAPLHPAAAITLLATTAGHDRVAAEYAAAEQVVAACGNLPLAVRIAGGRLGRSPALRLDRLARSLANDGGRLDELALGETTVRTGLSLSYHALPTHAQRLLRALGALRAAVVPVWAVPALLRETTAAANVAVEDLIGASLVTAAGSARTGEPRLELHDLVRLFAGELAEPVEADRALAALLADAAGLVRQATRGLPWPSNMLPPWYDAGAGCDAIPDPDPGPDRGASVGVDPAGWLADERDFLLHLVVLASRRGRYRDAAAVMHWLHIPLVTEARWQEYRTGQEAVRDAARAAGDLDAANRADYAMASALAVQGDPAAAMPAVERCLAYFDRIADRHGAASALVDLGLCHLEQGATEAGAAAAARAQALYRELGDRHGLARALRVLGMAHHARGEYGPAARLYSQVRELAADLGQPLIEAHALNSASVTMLAMGRYQEAFTLASRGADLFAVHGERDGVGYQRYLSGIALAGTGQRAAARDVLQGAHTLLAGIGDIRGTALAARDLAALTMDEHPAAAAVTLRDSMETLHLQGLNHLEATAARLLAVALERTGDTAGAKDVRARADALEPPGNSHTDRLLGILVGSGRPHVRG
jgi:DNA-binding SARP family transcriptional activator/tetratricopeptide (TPR) repeat protein